MLSTLQIVSRWPNRDTISELNIFENCGSCHVFTQSWHDFGGSSNFWPLQNPIVSRFWPIVTRFSQPIYMPNTIFISFTSTS